jgi:hypothetical protein
MTSCSYQKLFFMKASSSSSVLDLGPGVEETKRYDALLTGI